MTKNDKSLNDDKITKDVKQAPEIHTGEMFTRERIIYSARELMWVHGFGGTTTKMIAEKAGINEVTLFRIFKNKQNIVVEMLKYMGGKESPLHDFLEKDFENLDIFLDELCDLFFAKFLDVKDIFFLCIKESGGDKEEFREVVTELMISDTSRIALKMHKIYMNSFKDAAGSSSKTEEDFEIAAFMLMNSLIIASIFKMIMKEETFPYDLKVMSRKAKNVLFHGLI